MIKGVLVIAICLIFSGGWLLTRDRIVGAFFSAVGVLYAFGAIARLTHHAQDLLPPRLRSRQNLPAAPAHRPATGRARATPA